MCGFYRRCVETPTKSIFVHTKQFQPSFERSDAGSKKGMVDQRLAPSITVSSRSHCSIPNQKLSTLEPLILGVKHPNSNKLVRFAYKTLK